MAKPVQRETAIQRGIVTYLRTVLPSALVHHSPGESHLGGKSAMMATVRKKADGMLPGFPDVVVLEGGQTVFFEVKAPQGRVSPAQKVIHGRLRDLGYLVAVVRSVDDVRACLAEWQVPTVEKIIPKQVGAK